MWLNKGLLRVGAAGRLSSLQPLDACVGRFLLEILLAGKAIRCVSECSAA